MKERLQKWIDRWFARGGKRPTLNHVIWFSFTMTAVVASLIMGVSFYGRFLAQAEETAREENQFLMEQGSYSVTTYLRGMMNVSDSLYYGVIKNRDLSEPLVGESFQLLYETYKDDIEHIALFSEDGELLQVASAGSLFTYDDITEEDWYQETLSNEENIYFGKPEVSRYFSQGQSGYSRVIPMSRVVQMNVGESVERGILLIELKYSAIEDLFGSVVLGGESYLYLTDGEGSIIYHPEQQMFISGYGESGLETALEETNPDVFEQTLGYTGWKVIGVTQTGGISFSSIKTTLFVAFLVLFFLDILLIINSFLSRRVSAPLGALERAAIRIEEGDLDTEIQPSGFLEVWYLGTAMNRMKNNLKRLMEDMLKEHEAKRKSEILVLQNQINPHFLYNTLDIIVWMIENEKKEQAVKVVTALARFFRISLSRGKAIITIADEVEHVRNYLTIQEMRFKNRFSYSIHLDEDVSDLGTIKLILQPIVENAIYHAMEFMDGDGMIDIRVRHEGTDILFEIEDNGSGMTEDKIEAILHGETSASSKGTGVGLQNVRERIGLVFGEPYGLYMESEPDEGTKVTLRIPAITYEALRDRGLD